MPRDEGVDRWCRAAASHTFVTAAVRIIIRRMSQQSGQVMLEVSERAVCAGEGVV
ncbi:MAG: hypothetical protein ABJ370_00015 [Paracoccaceae bacterium]